MGKIVQISGLAACLCLAGLLATGSGASAKIYDVSRLRKMPDFSQTDPALNLPNGGRFYCAPVAAANALVWLAARGRVHLLPTRFATVEARVAEVARQLGGPDLMSTAPQDGTSTGRFMYGLGEFAKRNGYLAQIDYRSRHSAVRGGPPPGEPDMNWVRDRFDDGAAMWLSIGWYEKGRGNGEYRRIGGHMVTLVGYGLDENGRADRNMLIVHDPGNESSRTIEQRYLSIEPMREGVFLGRNNRRLGPVRGQLQVREGYRLDKGVVAIIDSVIIFSL